MTAVEQLPTDRPADDTRAVSTFVFVVLLAFFLLLLHAIDGSNFLQDPDTYWHIADGRRIWETGAVPRVDEWSYTMQGRPWIAKDWLSELLLFGAYSLGGWHAVALLTACTIAFTFAALYLVLSRELRLTVAVGVTAFVYVFSSTHLLARPHIFSFPLVIVWFAGLVRAAEGKVTPSPLLLAVMALWANIHGSFTLGLAFAGAFAAEAFFAAKPGERFGTAMRWGLFLLAALVAACISPYGYRSILVTFQLLGANEAVSFIQEWQPLFGKGALVHPLLVLALLFLALYYGIKVPFWRLLQVLALGYGMLLHVRLAPLFAIIAPILLMAPLARQFRFLAAAADDDANRRLVAALQRASRVALYPLCALVVLGTLASALLGAPISPKANITPAGAVDYIARQRLHGNIYNDYNFGGYLIFRGIKTFVDGRSDQLFSGEFLGDLLHIVEKEPSGFIPLLQKYDVTMALVRPGAVDADLLEHSALWSKAYSDENSQLYVRK
jgi:hypothetical protein